VKVVLAAPAVPAGRHARRALELLEEDAAHGAGYREKVLANVVSQEANVRLVLAKVALGEADAGFVYATDARGEPRVAVLPLPEPIRVGAEYAIGLVRADAPEGARAFVRAALGPPGRRVLAERGFGLP
jgi:molybdate transport system substrate-binding protein